MNSPSTIADALLSGDEAALTEVLNGPLLVARNNFVERPWGGTRIREHKRLHPLPDQAAVTGLGIGEAFELAAFDEDAEAARFASRVMLADGSSISLAVLLRHHGRRILGETFVERYGPRLPLLPKTLDVRELLSVQGHPEGNTEVYIIIDAEPGATIALGFNADVDPDAFGERLRQGLARQAELMSLLAAGADLFALHNRIHRWFAARDEGFEPPPALVAEELAPGVPVGSALALLAELKRHYWHVLDSLNHIEVAPGQVIYNATPSRLLAGGRLPSAEVHALGNPSGLEVIALEIRLPGPTFRAWDNVRFPQRQVDVDAAIAALNLAATTPAEFIREELPVAGRPGVTVSVDSEFFRIEHLRPAAGAACTLSGDGPACLHVIDGHATFRGPDGRPLAELGRGDSALVPADSSGCSVAAAGEGAHIVCVTLPCD